MKIMGPFHKKGGVSPSLFLTKCLFRLQGQQQANIEIAPGGRIGYGLVRGI